MPQLVARDVMTTTVHTVQPATPILEVARLLAAHHISGVPVVDLEGRVVGIISEADLLDEHKREVLLPGVQRAGLWPLDSGRIEEAARQARALWVRDLMSAEVVTATEDSAAPELAAQMVWRKINRIPILRDGRLVGIVSRGDLVRALAGVREGAEAPAGARAA